MLRNTTLACFAAALALMGCTTNNNTTGTDSGMTGNDSGMTGNDTGMTMTTNDSGMTGSDTGMTGNDTGMVGNDAGMTAPTCAAYCTSVMTACTGANAQYTTMDNCMSACANLGWAAGMTGDMAGNTLGCRSYHAGAAGMSATAATTHCAHAGPLGGAVCGTSNCTDFCAADLHVCTGAQAAYATNDACMTACRAFTDATTASVSPTATASPTLSCRTYHLIAASASASAATTHCAHTAMTSSVCH